jgi:hypothetical protein|eukprot:COSAG01_NODE_8591_length_2725_cov_55.670602_4_plen_73_part_00
MVALALGRVATRILSQVVAVIVAVLQNHKVCPSSLLMQGAFNVGAPARVPPLRMTVTAVRCAAQQTEAYLAY